MKLSATVFASLFIAVGVSACSSEVEQEESKEAEIGQVQQPLCIGYPFCKTVKTWGSGGVFDPGTGGGTLDPGGGGQTGYCPPRPTRICGEYLAETSPGVYECVLSCGGGGTTYVRYNPCAYPQRYTCNYAGECRCVY